MSIELNNLDKENKKILNNEGIIVSRKELIGYAICEAITCRNYAKVPISIDYMMRDINLVCDEYFKKVTNDYDYKTFKTLEELEDFIKLNLIIKDSFQQLNISEREFQAGKRNENEFVCTSAYNTLSEQDDFVDLDAYARNLAQDLLRNNLEIDFRSFKYKSKGQK